MIDTHVFRLVEALFLFLLICIFMLCIQFKGKADQPYQWVGVV